MAGVLVTREWVRKVERRLKHIGADRQPRAQRRPKSVSVGVAGFNAKVVELGPAGEADSADQRYWVAWATATNTAAANAETLEFSGEEIAGILGTRTDATSGQIIGLPEGHGLTEGQRIDLTWIVAPAGRRRWALIGAVGATTAYFSAGSGDDLPAAVSAMTVVVIEIVMATNRSEDVSLTHYAREGQGVQVWAEADATDPAVVRYFFAFMPWLLAFIVGGLASSAGAQHQWEAASYWYNAHYGWLGKADPRREDGGGLMKFAVLNGELYGVGLGWTHWVGPNPGDIVTWYVVKWDRAAQAWISWDGSGVNAHTLGAIRDVLVWSDRLWIIGDVTGAGDAHLAVWSWDGVSVDGGGLPVWAADALPGSTPITGYCLCVYADDLYAGVSVPVATEVGGVYRKTTAGGAWGSVGSGLSSAGWPTYPSVYALAEHDGDLIAAGLFDRANGAALAVANIAAWNGSTWSALSTGLPPINETNTRVWALASFEDGDELPSGPGPHLYAGGQGFTTFGNLARWNGTAWVALYETLSSVASGPTPAIVYALAVYRGKLVVGGQYHVKGEVLAAASMTGPLIVRVDDAHGTIQLRRGHGVLPGDRDNLHWTAGGGGDRWTVLIEDVIDLTLTDTSGVLTTRTNDTDGVITLTAGHPFRTGDTVRLDWTTGTGGHRRGVLLGTVGATTIPFSGGSGTLLRNPGTGEEIDVSVDVSSLVVGVGVDPDTSGDALPAVNTDIEVIPVVQSGSGYENPYELNLCFYADGAFLHAGGGIGHAQGYGLALESGWVTGLSVVQYDGFGPVPTMFIGFSAGNEPTNQIYGSRAALLTARGWRPPQAGLAGSMAYSMPGGVYATLRRGYKGAGLLGGNRGAGLMGGSFTLGRNENIDDANAGSVPETVHGRNIMRWTGRYLEAVGQIIYGGRGLESAVLSMTEYGDLPVVAGAQLAPHRLAIGAGTLTTRTSDTAGVVTLTEPHGFTNGVKIDLFWTGGRRARATVGTVAGAAVPFSGGSGDDLPAAGTAIEATGDFVRVFPDQSNEPLYDFVETQATNGLCANQDDLYMLLESATADKCVFLWNGSTVANISPVNATYGWTIGKSAIVADLDGGGPKVYACGSTSGGTDQRAVLVHVSGTTWNPVGSNAITGECYSLAMVDYGGDIGKRLYACGSLVVNAVECTVAELREGLISWQWFPIASAVVVGNKGLAIAEPQGTWERPHLTLLGDHFELHDIEANVDLVVNNVAEYHPTTFWRAQAYGGVNAAGMSLGRGQGVLSSDIIDGGDADSEFAGILDGGAEDSIFAGTLDGGPAEAW